MIKSKRIIAYPFFHSYININKTCRFRRVAGKYRSNLETLSEQYHRYPIKVIHDYRLFEKFDKMSSIINTNYKDKYSYISWHDTYTSGLATGGPTNNYKLLVSPKLSIKNKWRLV